jgi:two-component system, chemotaxis family, sensor kinase CheA
MGRVALILDVLGIGQRSGVLAESREQARAAVGTEDAIGDRAAAAAPVPGRFLRAPGRSAFSRRQARGVSAVSIERAGGARWCNTGTASSRWFLSGTCSNPGAPDQDQTADPVQVIVFNDGDRSVGVVVDQILDVAEEAVTVRQKSSRKGLLGSAVVGKRVTDFLDLN